MDKKHIKLIAVALGVLVLVMLLGKFSKSSDKPVISDSNTGCIRSVNTVVQSNPYKVGQDRIPYSSSSMYLHLVFAVFIVACLGFGVYWMGRKLGYKSIGNKNSQIEVLETAHLAGRKTLHIIRVGGKKILIGSTNDSICALADLSDSFSKDKQ